MSSTSSANSDIHTTVQTLPKDKPDPPTSGSKEQEKDFTPRNPLETKDIRATYHARQRVKRGHEFAKLRFDPVWIPKLYLRKSGFLDPSSKDKPFTHQDMEVYDDALSPMSDSSSKAVSGGDLLSSTKIEVNLSDLVVHRKSRKGTDEDFEVIPHTRSVIALDDNMTYDTDIAEPWEHVFRVDAEESAVKNPTYAKIVSLTN